MRNIIFSILIFLTVPALAGKDVSSSMINYVYQLDSDETVFEFNSSVKHGCGSHLYRVESPSAAVANRKFALVLAAFMGGKKIAFHDRESCLGSRSSVAWIRLIN